MSDHTMYHCCIHLSHFSRFRFHLTIFEVCASRVLSLILFSPPGCIYSTLFSFNMTGCGKNYFFKKTLTSTCNIKNGWSNTLILWCNSHIFLVKYYLRHSNPLMSRVLVFYVRAVIWPSYIKYSLCTSSLAPTPKWSTDGTLDIIVQWKGTVDSDDLTQRLGSPCATLAHYLSHHSES